MATIEQTVWQGSELYILENGSLRASLLPGIGSNVIRLYDKAAERDVLRAPDSLETLREKSVHYGIPLLLPPSRIRNGSFPFNGSVYTLERNTPDGQHHIHGFLRSRPWRVVESSTSGDSASVTTEVRTTDFPELASQYPHELTVRVRTTIDGLSLVQTFDFSNDSGSPAPFGFGLHTWFLLDQTPDQWTLQLPVEDVWELNEQLLATGNRRPLGAFSPLNDGLNLQGQNMDNAFRIGANKAEAVLSRPGCTIRYSADGSFTQWVVYTQGETRETICLEPLTWTPDAPNLDAAPELTGMRAIAPGETLSMQVTLAIAHGPDKELNA